MSNGSVLEIQRPNHGSDPSKKKEALQQVIESSRDDMHCFYKIPHVGKSLGMHLDRTVTVSVTVSATVWVTGSSTVSVGVSRAVVEVLGPAAAMLVPAVELSLSGVLESAGGRAGTWSGHFIAYAAGRCAWHLSSMVTALWR
jgi:hypothetical protein